MAYHGGFNTAHGADQGPPPPGAGAPWGPFQQYQQPYMQPYAWPQQPQMMQPPYVQAATQPAPPPIDDGGIPGVHLRNYTGGVGVPSGFNYLFPTDHCQLHLFKGPEKPWQVSGLRPFIGLVVPSNMSIKEFMQQIGLNNDDAKMNVIYEIVEKGNGFWSHGLKITGDNKDKVKKTVADYGWTNPGRNRSKMVALWASKNGA